nr:hypothetical protein [Acinetobacter sp. Marseille-Q1620]
MKLRKLTLSITLLLNISLLSACNESADSHDSTAAVYSNSGYLANNTIHATNLSQSMLAVSTTAENRPDAFTVNELKKDIYNGIFTGNGLVGTMTYLSSDSPSSVRIDLGRTDLYDHRTKDGTYVFPDTLFLQSRFPLGHFELNLGSTITTASGKMDIYTALATASVNTENSQQFKVKTRTLADEDIVIIEIEGNTAPVQAANIKWITEPSVSPRQKTSGTIAGYQGNADVQYSTSGNNSIYSIAMLAGGGYGLGYKTITQGNKTTIIATTYYSREDSNVSEKINQTLERFDLVNLNNKIQMHEKHWHDFYQKSVYRMPDPKLQAFYNMQLYKFGSSSREGGPAIDLQGPWAVNKTPWPGYWFNLNMQLTYSPLYASNHLELAKTLVNVIDKNKQNLINNVPEQYQNDSAAIGRTSGADLISPVLLSTETDGQYANNNAQSELGNLTWLLYYYYQHYRYSMDANIGNNLFDILKRSVQYQLHLLKKNTNGKYEFAVKTYSPEYPNAYDYNTNYDLAILKWGLNALISLNSELKKNDVSLAKWKDAANNLIDFPQDATGFKISSNIAYTQSHRHYSHLMMIYPFYQVNWDQQENRNLIQTSINTWQSKTSALQGYSFTGNASMQAMMGNGDKALQALQTLLNTYVKPNTLYAETGPVIETPFSAMTSLQELSLQYWDGIVRVFPAIPSQWKDLSFDNFRTDGAFLISAKRVAGINSSITIKSEAGGTIKIKPNLGDKVFSPQKELPEADRGVYTLSMQKGEILELKNGG